MKVKLDNGLGMSYLPINEIDPLPISFGKWQKVQIKNDHIGDSDCQTSITVDESLIWTSDSYQWKMPSPKKFDLKTWGKSPDGNSVDFSVQNINFLSEE